MTTYVWFLYHVPEIWGYHFGPPEENRPLYAVKVLDSLCGGQERFVRAVKIERVPG